MSGHLALVNAIVCAGRHMQAPVHKRTDTLAELPIDRTHAARNLLGAGTHLMSRVCIVGLEPEALVSN
jgi:hypothetical protein